MASQLAPFRSRAKRFEKQGEEFEKAQGDQGREAFENTLGGLSGGSPGGP